MLRMTEKGMTVKYICIEKEEENKILDDKCKFCIRKKL